MFTDDHWIIIDTETTGLLEPIHPVEIAAQRMLGWNTFGEPFRVLIDCDAAIEPQAERIHGYTRAFLRENGVSPGEALASFQEYAKSSPLVAYNISYDWDRVLKPAYERLGFDCSLVPGFCALALMKKLFHRMPDYKLATLIRTFNLAEKQTHHALDDVMVVMRLFSNIIKPHLSECDIHGFQRIVRCSEGKLSVPLVRYADPLRSY